MTNDEVITMIKDTAPTATHRERLSQMLIGFLNNPQTKTTHSEMEQQEIYLTFYILNNALKEIE
jgi:hypothetical protein